LGLDRLPDWPTAAQGLLPLVPRFHRHPANKVPSGGRRVHRPYPRKPAHFPVGFESGLTVMTVRRARSGDGRAAHDLRQGMVDDDRSRAIIDDTAVVIEPDHLDWPDLFNARDLGGLPTYDGQVIGRRA